MKFSLRRPERLELFQLAFDCDRRNERERFLQAVGIGDGHCSIDLDDARVHEILQAFVKQCDHRPCDGHPTPTYAMRPRLNRRFQLEAAQFLSARRLKQKPFGFVDQG